MGRVLTLAILGLLLQGCAIYSKEFTCEVGKGVGCESVSTVNRLVNDEKLEDFIAENASAQQRCRGSGKTAKDELGAQNNEPIKVLFNDMEEVRVLVSTKGREA